MTVAFRHPSDEAPVRAWDAASCLDVSQSDQRKEALSLILDGQGRNEVMGCIGLAKGSDDCVADPKGAFSPFFVNTDCLEHKKGLGRLFGEIERPSNRSAGASRKTASANNRD